MPTVSRQLSADERALWQRVTADLRAAPASPTVATEPRVASLKPPQTPQPSTRPARPRGPSATLDAAWNRKLRTGQVVPDRVVDLHGCTVDQAHRRAIDAVVRAEAAGDRVVVLITGKPPAVGTSRVDAPLRGVIRASIGDWLAASPVADRIAAVRAAHPRHGGSGAIYVILRRSAAVSNRFL